MKNYDKNTTSSYLMYLDVNNLHGWAMSQKLSVKVLNGQKSYLNLTNYVENRKGYFLEVDVKYPEKIV